MKVTPMTWAAALLLTVPALAQREPDEVPLMRADEAKVVDQQARDFVQAVRPSARQAGLSTVWIWAEGRRKRDQVAFGTVIGDGTQVLTKWSEIALAPRNLQVVGGDGRTARATVLGIYQEEDLALLQLDGVKFRPVEWSTKPAPGLGRFLVASSPDDMPASVGVVSVAARSLREKDQAYLGVMLDGRFNGKGVRISEIQQDSAAGAAGLRDGDVIRAIAGKEVTSAFEMRNALLAFGPGDKIEIGYLRKGEEGKAEVQLKPRPHFPGIANGRLEQMEQMGGQISLVRTGFPSAIQADLKLQRSQCGGPVVDLDGRVIGVSIARADRTRSLVIPAAEIVSILANKPSTQEDVELAQRQSEEQQRLMAGADGEEVPQAPRAIPVEPGSADNLMRHLQDMERFMARMREEMDGIGEGEESER